MTTAPSGDGPVPPISPAADRSVTTFFGTIEDASGNVVLLANGTAVTPPDPDAVEALRGLEHPHQIEIAVDGERKKLLVLDHAGGRLLVFPLHERVR